jgi:hypothetical protein
MRQGLLSQRQLLADVDDALRLDPADVAGHELHDLAALRRQPAVVVGGGGGRGGRHRHVLSQGQGAKGEVPATATVSLAISMTVPRSSKTVLGHTGWFR